MSLATDTLIQLIKDMIGVLKTHTQTLQLDSLERDLSEQEAKLNDLQNENMEELQANMDAEYDEDMEGGGGGFELTIKDLSPEYRTFIANTMGYDTVDQLLADHPDLSDVILTSFNL